jgi:hypothetical protein
MAAQPPGGERNEKEKDKDVVSENRQVAEERSPEKLRERAEEVHQYLRARQAARSVAKTTRTGQGQDIDWIELESQTPDGRIADPPSDDGIDLRPAQDGLDTDARWPQKVAEFELEKDHGARGPKGTVPVLRRSAEVGIHGSLQDFLSKHGRPTRLMRLNDETEIPVPADNSTHVYAFSSQVGTCYGGEGNVNIWSPYIEWSDEMTLGQLALHRGMGFGFQTVEAGWQKLPNLYGDWKTHLFVFYTSNGYSVQGDNLGGYNQDVDGWVQVSSTIFPGSLLSVSSYLGPQYVVNLKYQLSGGNWWLRVNGSWIGYYPATLFQFFGLSSQAAGLDWYGEIADSADHVGTSSTDMGSGRFPWEGWQKAAYMNQLSIQSLSNGTLAKYTPGTVWATNSACYGIDPHFNNTSSWGPYFFWGGTGKNNLCP